MLTAQKPFKSNPLESEDMVAFNVIQGPSGAISQCTRCGALTQVRAYNGGLDISMFACTYPLILSDGIGVFHQYPDEGYNSFPGNRLLTLTMTSEGTFIRCNVCKKLWMLVKKICLLNCRCWIRRTNEAAPE
jgi:hypothetical protein